MIQWDNKPGSGIWKYKITDDLICVVTWNLNKWNWTKRKGKFNPKKGMHQKQGFSDNQYKYQAHIFQGDQTRKYFYSNNFELIKKLIINYAKNLIKKRIKQYQEILKECIK